jgi:hypothetical protein
MDCFRIHHFLVSTNMWQLRLQFLVIGGRKQHLKMLWNFCTKAKTYYLYILCHLSLQNKLLDLEWMFKYNKWEDHGSIYFSELNWTLPKQI